MRRVLVPGLLSLALVAGAAASARADFIFQSRLVSFRVGRAPTVVVPTQAQYPPVAQPPTAPTPLPVQPPPGVPLEIAPPAPAVPLPGDSVVPPPLATLGRPLTVKEFACSFHPACGTYSVVLLHPYSCCPVNVCFTLPAGCPRVKVKTCLRQRLEFDYGKCEVELVFYRNGKVKVNRH
jgi:hypothetical protein